MLAERIRGPKEGGMIPPLNTLPMRLRAMGRRSG
jgi:hypothetical protein